MFRKSTVAAAVVGAVVFATPASASGVQPGPAPDIEPALVGVPGPIAGAGLPDLLVAGAALIAWKRRNARRSKRV